MRVLLLIFSLFIFHNQAAANPYYIEVDPFAYGLNGHSVHVGVESHGFRLQGGIFQADFPDSFKDNESFDVTQGGYGFKIDYYGRSEEGLFFGIEYAKTRVTLKNNGSKAKRDVDLAGIRVGYKMMLNNSWYITPWVGIDRDTSADDSDRTVQINGERYKLQEYTLFPTIHFGMEF